MRETFRQKIPSASEKPGVRLLEARALFDMYKISAAKDEIKFKVSDLIKLSDAFKENPSFEKDREWVRDQLVEQFKSQPVETRLTILDHLAEDDRQLASRLMEEGAERIKSEYVQRKQSAKNRDASWETRNGAQRLGQALDKTINKIYDADNIEEIEEKIGYKNPLDETLQDRDYKTYKVHITHLKSPELKDTAVISLEEQWRDVTNFLKQVEVPAEVIEKWTGDSIADRKHFLSEKTNQALAVGVELINKMPPEQQELAGIKLLELCKTADSLMVKLQWSKNWSAPRREVSLPFDLLDNAEIFREFVEERVWQEKNNQNKEKNKGFEIELEHQLARVGIERNIPELAEVGLNHIEKHIKKISLTDCDSTYEALLKRAEIDEHYRGMLDKFRTSYEGLLREKLPESSVEKELDLIEDRLADFLDPVKDWDQTSEVLEAMQKFNVSRRSSGYTTYFPKKLIDKCLQSLEGTPEEERKEHFSLIEQFSNQGEKMPAYFSETLIKYDMWEDAARYAGTKNFKYDIAKIMQEGGEAAIETIWQTKGWDPAGVASVITNQAREKKLASLAPVLEFFDRYRFKYDQINRERSVVEDALSIEKELRGLITRSKDYRGEYIPSFGEDEVIGINDRIREYRSFLWELWQQGRVPRADDKRGEVLKMFVEDGRDLAVAELGLTADQKIDLSIASANVALEHKDMNAFKKALSEAKRFKAYEKNQAARDRVAGLEKEQEMLTLQTNIAEMKPDRLRLLFEQSSFLSNGKDQVLNVLIDSGRYHDAIILCGNLGQERIARQLINKGAFDIAEELIKTAPAKIVPNRQALSVLIAYRRAGGELKPEYSQLKEENVNKLIEELPALLRNKGLSKEEIFTATRQYLSEDQRLIVDRCTDIMGQSEFFKAAPSYESNTLKRFYLDVLVDRRRDEEAVRFAVLHEDGMLSHLVKRLAEKGSMNGVETLLYKVSDMDTALLVTNTLVEAGQKEIARNFVKRFVGTINDSSPIFKNIHVSFRDGGSDIKNRASEQDQIKNIADLKRLIFTSGSLESLAHIHSLFKSEENLKRFVEPIFEGLTESEVKPKELAKLLSTLGQGVIGWYSNLLIARGSSKNIGSLIGAIEIIMPRAEAMKRYPDVYASSIAFSAKEVFVEDLRKLTAQERVQRFIDLYSKEEPKDAILLASISLDKQEWKRFLQSLPAEDRERAVMLADWYSSPRLEEKDLGPIVERSASKITQAIESNDLESLRLSLDTLLSAHTSDAASKLTKIFLQHLEGGGSTGTTYMLVRTLADIKSFKANTVLSEIMSAPGVPDILSRYIIRLLVGNGHLDPDLRGYFEEKRISDKAEDGEKLKDAVDLFRTLFRKYGINPDSSIMRYTDGRSTADILSSFESMIEQVKTFEEKGEYEALSGQLMGDLNMRLLYFLRNGGRTKFSLINDYNFAKFTNVLKIGQDLKLHNEPFGTFEQTIRQSHGPESAKQIIEQIRLGRFPLASGSGEAVFDCLVDSNSESQIEQARLVVGNTLGRNEFGAFVRALMYRSFLDQLPDQQKTKEVEDLWQSAGQDMGSLDAFLQYCESTFGAELEKLNMPVLIEKNSSDDLPLRQSVSDEVLDVGITKIEPALTALGKRLADNARKSAQQKKISKEERDRLVVGYQNSETVLPTLLSSEFPPSFAPVLDEWKSHVQGAIQTSREARMMSRGESQIRQLSLRYLDKTASLPEYLRFADSAMCCFTSKDFQGAVGAQEYIARIWKDPLSFVFHIEEPTGGQSDRRSSVGFVFGSYGTNREGEPVLIMNGVYMDRKTDLAARKVLQTIEQQLAKPLGCKEMLVASLHAGRTNYGADYENTDREYLRLRAIKHKWNEVPEQHTYDDIGLIAVEAKEGVVADSQAVNRWAKTSKHILRKQVS
jgi:hypothetical protein